MWPDGPIALATYLVVRRRGRAHRARTRPGADAHVRVPPPRPAPLRHGADRDVLLAARRTDHRGQRRLPRDARLHPRATSWRAASTGPSARPPEYAGDRRREGPGAARRRLPRALREGVRPQGRHPGAGAASARVPRGVGHGRRQLRPRHQRALAPGGGAGAAARRRARSPAATPRRPGACLEVVADGVGPPDGRAGPRGGRAPAGRRGRAGAGRRGERVRPRGRPPAPGRHGRTPDHPELAAIAQPALPGHRPLRLPASAECFRTGRTLAGARRQRQGHRAGEPRRRVHAGRCGR